MENKRTSWTLKEISDQASIAYPSLKLVMPRLLARKIVFVERDLGKVKLYKLNEQNAVVKQLLALDKEIVRQETGVKRSIIAELPR
jgi:hypothetical protein